MHGFVLSCRCDAAVNIQDKDKIKGDKVSSLFDRARQSGAVEGSHEDLEGPSTAFRGTGHTLTGAATSHQVTYSCSISSMFLSYPKLNWQAPSGLWAFEARHHILSQWILHRERRPGKKRE